MQNAPHDCLIPAYSRMQHQLVFRYRSDDEYLISENVLYVKRRTAVS